MSSFLPAVPSINELTATVLVWGMISAATALLFLFVLYVFYRRLYHTGASFNKVTLLITVPKRSQQQDEDSTIEKIRQQIAVAETFFAAIAGLRADRSVSSYVLGRRDHLSLELVASQGLLSFYIVVPASLRRYVEQQIHAQYPDANIDVVIEPNIFLSHGVVRAAGLRFRRSFMFPLRTYNDIETDPLAAVTNAFSRVGTNGAALQIVIRSAKRRWHRFGQRTAAEFHQGHSFREAYARGQRSTFMRGVSAFMRAFHNQAMPKQPAAQAEQVRPHQLSALEQEMAKRVEQKTSKAGVEANIRIVVSASTEHDADRMLDNMVQTFSQYNLYQYGNSFVPVRVRRQVAFIRRFIHRQFVRRNSVILNTEELASLFHFPLPSTETPNIRWLRSKKAPPPNELPDEGIVLGVNRYRGVDRVVHFDPADRRRHCYIIGTTGSGKSVLMGEMAKQDIKAGHGVCIIDPHGSLVEEILESIPPERAKDVIYFDPSDTDRPLGLNMLEATTPAEMDFATQEMIAIFYKLVSDPSMIGPMFEHNMRNAMLTLMADPSAPGTLVEIPRMFTDTEFQRRKVKNLTDPIVKAFWEQEMAKTSDFHKSEMLGYLISKVGRFIENAMMRNIIGQPNSAFDFRRVMDEKKIFLVNLSKGKIGEMNANLLGLIIVSKLQMAALSRADSPADSFPDFYLYIDEFQNFITDSIATILSEARKYKLNLVMAHQYVGQLVQGQDTKIRDAVLGNVGTIISFRVGVEDAEVLAKEFAPVFSEYDLINVDRYHAYVRLLVHNSVTRPFDIDTYPPTIGSAERALLLREASRLRYGKDRQSVENDILLRSKIGQLGVTNAVDGPAR
ncbi:MAG: type IV secretion system DNA-binding domain-containing protein [Patescibacteria group bacterium]